MMNLKSILVMLLLMNSVIAKSQIISKEQSVGQSNLSAPQSMYIPLTEDELRARAYLQYVEQKRREDKFNEYMNLAEDKFDSDEYNACIYYAKIAESYKYVSSKLFELKGASYYSLKKFGKVKRTIRQARKHGYFEVVNYLQNLLNERK